MTGDRGDRIVTERELGLVMDARLSRLERRLYVVIAAAFVGLKFNIPTEASVAALSAIAAKTLWSAVAARFGA